jgi:LytS/YehU family sensor histidine kinase
MYLFNRPNAGFTEIMVSIMPFFVIGIVLGILLKLTRATIQKQVQDEQAKTGQKQSELNLLQSQLSPHFLFNTLNNLYGISIAQHERLPGLLLKLSDLLRYSVYGTKKPFVPLKEELDYINNYIDFEKIRISDRLLLKTDIEAVTSATVMIAPMVLIVFIENAFKHAKNTLEQKIYIDISLKFSGNFIVFAVINSHNANKDKHNVLNESSGLGLANTIRRLGLLYGDDYQLKQYAEVDTYTIHLTLPIKQQ